MRRKEKEIKAFEDIETILKREKICRLALSDNNTPYLIPLSYGYANKTLYFHSADEGMKIKILKTNPNVCFEVESNVEVVTAPLPCKWGMKFETVIGNGIVEFIEDPTQKIEALKTITNHYGAPAMDNIKPETLQNIVLFKIIIKSIQGKRSGL